MAHLQFQLVQHAGVLGLDRRPGSAAGAARPRRAGPGRPRQRLRELADGLDGRPPGELSRLVVGRVGTSARPDSELRRDSDNVRPDVQDSVRFVTRVQPRISLPRQGAARGSTRVACFTYSQWRGAVVQAVSLLSGSVPTGSRGHATPHPRGDKVKPGSESNSP